MKISFIIPVYKVERYLKQSVGSITGQTYRDIEVILVDDGSPDSCPQMCDDFAATDNRIRVIHKANGGLSDARNVGLNAATGDYVIFIDSDDFWLHNDDLQKLVRVAETNPQVDFIGFNCSYYFQDKDSFTKWTLYDNRLAHPTEKDEALRLLTSTSSFVMSAWTKMLKLEFLLSNDLYFIKGQLSEDIPWFINLLDSCRKCMFVNDYVYAYRQGVSGSITNSISERNIDNLIRIIETELEKMPSRTFANEGKDCVMSFLGYEYSIILGYLQFLDKEKGKEKYKYLKRYKYLLNYTIDPKVKKVHLATKLLGLGLTAKLLQRRIKHLMK